MVNFVVNGKCAILFLAALLRTKRFNYFGTAKCSSSLLDLFHHIRSAVISARFMDEQLALNQILIWPGSRCELFSNESRARDRWLLCCLSMTGGQWSANKPVTERFKPSISIDRICRSSRNMCTAEYREFQSKWEFFSFPLIHFTAFNIHYHLQLPVYGCFIRTNRWTINNHIFSGSKTLHRFSIVCAHPHEHFVPVVGFISHSYWPFCVCKNSWHFCPLCAGHFSGIDCDCSRCFRWPIIRGTHILHCR